MSTDAAVEYFGGDELPANVWSDKYGLRDQDEQLVEPNPDFMHWRIANELARVESKKFKNPYTPDFIYSLLKQFGPIIPQGSPMYGIGNPKFVSISNCFVTDCPTDSYGGILRTDEQLAQLCKRRGGVGTDLSDVRPDSMPTNNSARRATGVVPFMERFSNTIREVGQDGRRGALMISICVHHPQVLDFSRAKLDPNKVTGANVSIRLSDEFLQAVKDGTDYEQRWPVNSKTPQVSRKVNAREVWKEIIKCAHARAEPGLLFWDRIIRESPADCYSDCQFNTRSTNPCGEVPLSVADSCRLLVVNLFTCVKKPFSPDAEFDFTLLRKYAGIGQRLMDDIVDLEIECVTRILAKIDADPEPDDVKRSERELWQKVLRSAVQGRRTGLGITALGDAMAAVGIRYGSDESIEFTEKVYQTLKLGAYQSSVDMAKELGAFPVWDAEKEKSCPFLKRIEQEDPKLYREMQKWGRRNIALLTTAPTGSVSILAGDGQAINGPVKLKTVKPTTYFGTTSGIEPLFKAEPYTRRKKINHAEKGSRVDFTDAQGDRWTEYPVYHAKLKMWMDVTGETDWRKSPYAGCCAEDLDWKQRVRLQAAAQRHVDHSISSTINLPEDVTVEKVAEIYETAWEAGCKGITVYRKGCRDGVLVDKPKPQKEKVTKTTAPKRPKELPCDVHRTTVKGVDCLVFVGKLGDDPYEVFAAIGETDISPKCDTGHLVKEKRGDYKFKCDDDAVNLTEVLTDEQAAITRLASTALRHGADTAFVVHQLEKVKGPINGFAKAVARVLKKYISDGTKVTGEKCGRCESTSLVRQEGCVTCMSCGWTKCS